MISQLSTPVSLETPYGDIKATHEAYGFTNQAGWNGLVQSYRVLGKLDDTGKFVAFPNTEEYVTIKGADLKALLTSDSAGKQAGIFRTDDVVRKHKEIRARAAKG